MKALVILGPTAAGKSDLSLKVAGNIFEIISSDSVQVYRYLDIGSGKPALNDRERVKHYLIDIVNPDEEFSAGDFCREALKAAKEITEKGLIPLFAGGTGLYIDSFFSGIAEIPDIDKSIRGKLFADLNSYGLGVLYSELKRADPVFAGRVHPNDKQRILRGLEVFRQTGRPISSYFETNRGYESDETLYIGLYEERDTLRSRIDARVDRMIERGFVEEVQSVRNMGYSSGLKSMKSIGYNEINSYLDGEIALADSIEKIKLETKRYAKRQMTWFRKNRRINWYKPSQIKEITDIINKWVC